MTAKAASWKKLVRVVRGLKESDFNRLCEILSAEFFCRARALRARDRKGRKHHA